ncbi:TPA: hypothetical protein ACXP8K_003572 [Klebsiella pneumoniae]
MQDENVVPPFESWFLDLIALAAEQKKDPVYKGYWVDAFDLGLTPAEAIQRFGEALKDL